MNRLSFVLPYYDNSRMLALQYDIWANYPIALKSRIEIVIVDDGSPSEPAADVPRPSDLPPTAIYRVLIDKPWNQHGARNLGAKMATGPWLFLTDMDHILPAESLEKLLTKENTGRIFMFARLDAPDMTPTLGRDGEKKPHPNTFAMTKEMYWRIGGYDERFCGIYGTDALFRDRARKHAHFQHLPNVSIIRVPREVIPDASTRTLLRKDGRGTAKERVVDQIRRQRSEAKILTLAFPWERVV